MNQSEQEQVTRLKTLALSPSKRDAITPAQYVREGISEDVLGPEAIRKMEGRGYGGARAAIRTIAETSPSMQVVWFDGKRFMNTQTRKPETVSNVEQQAIDQVLNAGLSFSTPKDKGKMRMKVLTTYLNVRRKLWPEDVDTDSTDLSQRVCQPGEASRAMNLTIRAIIAAESGNPDRPQEKSSRWWKAAVAFDWALKIPPSEAVKQGLNPQ